MVSHRGDSSRVQDQLRNVQQICSTMRSFAATLADGTVVTWGDRHFGGDSARVQDQFMYILAHVRAKETGAASEFAFLSCSPFVAFHDFLRLSRGLSDSTIVELGTHLGLSENSVPLHPMVNDHYPY